MLLHLNSRSAKMVKTKQTQQEKVKKPEPNTSKPKSSTGKQVDKVDKDKMWSEAGFNESELTMSQLQNMIRTLAEQEYKKKYEKLKNDIEEEVEWRVTAQTEEMEETIESMKKEITAIREENKIVKKELSAIKEESDALKLENRKLNRKVERCEYKLSCLKLKHLHNLKVKLDEVEQKFFERDIQLVGVPELPEDEEYSEEKEIDKIVKLAKEKMEITIKANSIEKLHRLGKRKQEKPRDIVVRFRSNTTRNNFYQNRKKMINYTDSKNNIYANDHLTEYRRNVFYATRQLVKQKKVFAAWTQQGNILIRKNEGDQPEHIRSHEQLSQMKLVEDANDSSEAQDISEELDDYTDSDF